MSVRPAIEAVSSRAITAPSAGRSHSSRTRRSWIAADRLASRMAECAVLPAQRPGQHRLARRYVDTASGHRMNQALPAELPVRGSHRVAMHPEPLPQRPDTREPGPIGVPPVPDPGLQPQRDLPPRGDLGSTLNPKRRARCYPSRSSPPALPGSRPPDSHSRNRNVRRPSTGYQTVASEAGLYGRKCFGLVEWEGVVRAWSEPL